MPMTPDAITNMSSFPPSTAAGKPEIIVTYASTPSAEAQQTLLSLQQAVSEALKRKGQLGQYAIFWQDGRVVRVEAADLLADR